METEIGAKGRIRMLGIFHEYLKSWEWEGKENQRQNIGKLLSLKYWKHIEWKKVSNDRLRKKQIEKFRTVRIKKKKECQKGWSGKRCHAFYKQSRKGGTEERRWELCSHQWLLRKSTEWQKPDKKLALKMRRWMQQGLTTILELIMSKGRKELRW